MAMLGEDDGERDMESIEKKCRSQGNFVKKVVGERTLQRAASFDFRRAPFFQSVTPPNEWARCFGRMAMTKPKQGQWQQLRNGVDPREGSK